MRYLFPILLLAASVLLCVFAAPSVKAKRCLHTDPRRKCLQRYCPSLSVEFPASVCQTFIHVIKNCRKDDTSLWQFYFLEFVREELFDGGLGGGLLGALMLEKDSIIAVQEYVTPDAFYTEEHRTIYRAIEELSMELKPIDLYTVTERLKAKKELKKVGGASYLAQLTQKVGSAANVEFHAKIIAQKYVQRELIRSATEIQKRSYDESTDVTELIGYAEGEIFKVAEGHVKRSVQASKDILARALMQIEEASKNTSAFNGVPSGFMAIDRVTLGWQLSDLIIIAARPSMGKTSFGMNLIGYAATMAGKTTAVFSLEMPKDQLAMRLLCADARVDMQSVRHGSLRDDDWISLSSALGPLAASNIYIDDTSGITPSQLRSRCRRLKMEHGLDMIMVDYLQLMSADGHVENRQNEVSEISRNLKSIAKELNVPLVALAQLSRAGAQRSDKRPILSDLRDSGAIEQDADVIMFLHREEYYDPNTEDKNIAEVIVAKQRNGPLGTVKLAWLGQYTRFASLQQGGAAQ